MIVGQTNLFSRRKALLAAAGVTASVATLRGKELPAFLGNGAGGASILALI